MEHVTYGVTSDFDWYELVQVQNELTTLANRMDRLINAVRQRERTQHDYILHLRHKVDQLQARLNEALDK